MEHLRSLLPGYHRSPQLQKTKQNQRRHQVRHDLTRESRASSATYLVLFSVVATDDTPSLETTTVDAEAANVAPTAGTLEISALQHSVPYKRPGTLSCRCAKHLWSFVSVVPHVEGFLSEHRQTGGRSH